jgi:hypothetical protein
MVLPASSRRTSWGGVFAFLGHYLPIRSLCLGGGIRCCANGWSYPRGRLEVVTQMRKECPLFCVLICSPGLPLIVASRPAKSAIDIRAVMYHDGRRMDGERAR